MLTLHLQLSFVVKVDITHDGAYSIYMNGIQWLQSAPTYFYVDGGRKNLSDGSLHKNSTSAGNGLDQLGKFRFVRFSYTAGKYSIDCSIREYSDDFVIFDQVSGEDAFEPIFRARSVDTSGR